MSSPDQRQTQSPIEPLAPANIVLIGFMGTGKSSIGRLLARQLDRPYVDTDEMIVQRAGCSIPQIFAHGGEAEFRRIETEALETIGPDQGAVVATGGGIVVQEANRTQLRRIGFVVWLDAAEEEIFQRISRNTKRPLLQTPDPRATIHELLEARRPLYAQSSDCQVNTGTLSRKQAAREIRARAAQYFATPPSLPTPPSPPCPPSP